MFPVSTLTGTSATGDVVTGPGMPTILIHGLPIAHMADMVAGAACTGVIAGTMHPTMLILGLPVASLTVPISGVNPATGIPVASVEAVSTAVNFLV